MHAPVTESLVSSEGPGTKTVLDVVRVRRCTTDGGAAQLEY